MKVPIDIKEYVWNYIISLPKKERPYGCTDKRLNNIHDIIFETEDFWEDVVLRHRISKDIFPKLKEEDFTKKSY